MKMLYEVNANNYEKYVVSQRFIRPARDTAKIIAEHNGANVRVLDIGTGSGAVLAEVIKLNSAIKTFGLDSSQEMLEMARKKGIDVLIKCELPGIPFPNNYFDWISANFVLSHLANHEEAVFEISRVLKPNGRFVFTSWAGGQERYNSLFYNKVVKFISKEEYARIMEEYLPGEEFYGNADNLDLLLKRSKFSIVSKVEKTYKSRLSLDAYLNCRLNLLIGKYMRQVLSQKLWMSFQKDLRDSFSKEVGNTINYQGKVRFHICEQQ